MLLLAGIPTMLAVSGYFKTGWIGIAVLIFVLLVRFGVIRRNKRE